MNYFKKSFDIKKSHNLLNRSNCSVNNNDRKESISSCNKKYENLKKIIKKEYSKENNKENRNLSIKKEKNKIFSNNNFIHLNTFEQVNNNLKYLKYKSNLSHKRIDCNLTKIKKRKKVLKVPNLISIYKPEDQDMIFFNNYSSNTIKDNLIRNIKYREGNELYQQNLANLYENSYYKQNKFINKINNTQRKKI